MSVRTTFVVMGLSLAPVPAHSQIPVDTVRALAAIDREMIALGARYGGSIWPGYRPDTIPVAYVFPQRGTALLHWKGAPPPGYEAVTGVPDAAWLAQQNLGAASTGTSLGDRPVAQVVVSSLTPEDLVPLAFHEAFHVFEQASKRPGMRFGTGENSFYVASYPIFSVRNEALWSLEGRLLSAALQEKSLPKKRQLARQFVAVRRNRQSQLESSYAEFERASEMNEGLAEYALVRGLQLLAIDPSFIPEARANARKKLAQRVADLADLTQNVKQSFRLRFYQTGPAQALLLDELAPGWKKALMDGNQSLQDALAAATGLDAPERSAFRAAISRADTLSITRIVSARVEDVIALRKRQVDSVLSAPGLLLELSARELPNKDFNMCGFDPQNHLQVSPTVQMQTRWWRPCGGGATSEFNVPSVHDDATGTVSAVIGPREAVTLTVDGNAVALSDGLVIESATKVQLNAPRASVQAARARIALHGRTLQVTLLP